MGRDRSIAEIELKIYKYSRELRELFKKAPLKDRKNRSDKIIKKVTNLLKKQRSNGK